MLKEDIKMQKRKYESPEAEIEKFTIEDVVTGSGGGIGDYDNPIEDPGDF